MNILLEMAGGMGDEICSVPCIKHIRKLYPDSKITCKYRFRELLLGLDYIDEFARHNKPIAYRSFDKVFRFKWATGIYTDLGDQHLVDVFAIQNHFILEDRNLEIKIFDGEKEQFNYVKELGEKHPIICFDTFASATGNRWSQVRFFELISRLKNNYNAVVFQLGNVSKSDFVGLGEYMLERPIRDLAALMSLSHLFIGNNSGNAHLSSALRIPSVKIFSASDPKCFIHYPEIEKVVYSGVECRGCQNHLLGTNPLLAQSFKCPVSQWLCIESITVDEVYNACVEQLEKFYY